MHINMKKKTSICVFVSLLSLMFLVVCGLIMLGGEFFDYVGRGLHYIYYFLAIRPFDYKTWIVLLVSVISLIIFIYWINIVFKGDETKPHELIAPFITLMMPFVLFSAYRGRTLGIWDRDEKVLVIITLIALALYVISSLVTLVVSLAAGRKKIRDEKETKSISQRMAFSALGIALVAISTAFLQLNLGVSFVCLGDVFIFVISIIFGPFVGLLSGGFGSFFGDMIAYPPTMFYTLIIKGMEGFVVGLLAWKFRKIKKNTLINNRLWLFEMIIGSIVMVGGYFIAKAFFYGTMDKALVSLVPNILQATISTIIALAILNVFPNKKFSI